jgi:hypothetical protein
METESSNPTSSPTSAPAANNQNTAAQKPKSNSSVIIAAVVVIIIIIIAAAAYFLLAAKSSSSTSKLVAELSSPANKTPGGVINVVAGELILSNQVNVSYSGTAVVAGPSSSSLGSIQLNTPIKLSFEKYGNNFRIYFNATGIPLIGSINDTYIQLQNGTLYLCSSNSSIFTSQGSAPQGINCQIQPPDSGFSLSSLGNLNNPAFTSLENNLTVTVFGSSNYNGNSCALVGINGKLNQSISMNSTVCLSGEYKLPLLLNLSVTGDSGTSMAGLSLVLKLHEVSIGKPVTIAGISALTGPVVNSSSFYTTIPYTTLPYSSSSGTLSCTPANSEFNCTSPSFGNVTTGSVYLYNNTIGAEQIVNGTFITLTVSQDTGKNWTNATFVYVPAGTPLNSSGVPEVSFAGPSSSYQSLGITSDNLAVPGGFIAMQVSNQVSGTFTGSIWVSYYVSGNPKPQYAKFADVTVNAP